MPSARTRPRAALNRVVGDVHADHACALARRQQCYLTRAASHVQERAAGRDVERCQKLERRGFHEAREVVVVPRHPGWFELALHRLHFGGQDGLHVFAFGVREGGAASAPDESSLHQPRAFALACESGWIDRNSAANRFA